jgi:hypothetical protein
MWQQRFGWSDFCGMTDLEAGQMGAKETYEFRKSL